MSDDAHAGLKLAGTTRAKAPQSPSDLPCPAEELQSCAECLIPAGYRETLAVALCGLEWRHIGSNRQIARALVVARRTVAAHVEHILAKLSAPTGAHAAVRAEPAGLYIPARAEEGRPP